jgi:hypothetical protein
VNVPRYIARLVLEVTGEQDEALELITYCRNSSRPPARELAFDALEAFYSPFATASEGKSSEVVEEKARGSIAQLEAQILKIRHRFNIPVNPALYYPTVIAVPQMASATTEEIGMYSTAVPIPQRKVDQVDLLSTSKPKNDDTEGSREALAQFIGEDAEIILQEFPFKLS